MLDITEIGVYAPSKPPELHDAIVEMMVRKSGRPLFRNHDRSNCWLFIDKGDQTITGRDFLKSQHSEITLHDLEQMPDAAQTKEMTVAEISKELGYEVKIVK